MGLGKTLQTICIVASDHAYRASAFIKHNSPEFAHLPSLIVCPPSLCRHWLSEIQVFAPFLKAHIHGGNKGVRLDKAKDFSKYDVIITSYETLKTDVDLCFSGKSVFNYMVLDEGHLSNILF